MASAVAEAVGAFAAPRMRARVLSLALRWARRPDIPEWGPDVREFVEGPLLRAAEELLGVDLGAAIRDELAPMVRMMAISGVFSFTSIVIEEMTFIDATSTMRVRMMNMTFRSTVSAV